MIHWKLIGWLIWSNAITLLQMVQVALGIVMVQVDLFTHETYRYIVIANAVISGVVAQVKRNSPPGPRPERDDDSDPH